MLFFLVKTVSKNIMIYSFIWTQITSSHTKTVKKSSSSLWISGINVIKMQGANLRTQN